MRNNSKERGQDLDLLGQPRGGTLVTGSLTTRLRIPTGAPTVLHEFVAKAACGNREAEQFEPGGVAARHASAATGHFRRCLRKRPEWSDRTPTAASGLPGEPPSYRRRRSAASQANRRHCRCRARHEPSMSAAAPRCVCRRTRPRRSRTEAALGSLVRSGNDEQSLGRLAELPRPGYVRKGAAGEELVNAVRSALRGERHASEGPSKEP